MHYSYLAREEKVKQFIHNCQNVEATQISSNGQTEKLSVLYPCEEVLATPRKEQAINGACCYVYYHATQNNMLHERNQAQKAMHCIMHFI